MQSKVLSTVLICLLVISSVAIAGDFDWARDFNIKAEADPSGFRARLEARFRMGNMQIHTVLSNTKNPADAYTVLRLGEMSNQSISYVLQTYKAGKEKGWGALAKRLGIQPGSKDFHALKQGQDLYDNNHGGRGEIKRKGKGKWRR